MLTTFLVLWMSAQTQIQGSCAKCLVGTMTQQADETDGKPGAHIYSVEELEAQGWKKSEISVCMYRVFADKRVELDGPDCPASVVREAMHPAEPMDVPAVQEPINEGNVGETLGGYWSVDFAATKKGEWYLIDMAPGNASYHWPNCVGGEGAER